MALFGKKKDENKPEEKNAPNSINSKEMDIILQARQEEEEERKARIAEREAEQEEYRNAIAEDMTRAAEAAADVISMFFRTARCLLLTTSRALTRTSQSLPSSVSHFRQTNSEFS